MSAIAYQLSLLGSVYFNVTELNTISRLLID